MVSAVSFLFFVALKGFLGVTVFLFTPTSSLSPLRVVHHQRSSPPCRILQQRSRSDWYIGSSHQTILAANNNDDNEVAQYSRRHDDRQDKNENDDNMGLIASTMSSAPDTTTSTSSMPSLDDVLKKARRKKAVIPMAMLQAFGDAPLLVVGTDTPLATTFTRYDGLLVAIAFALHANGFALGLVFGKLTASPLRRFLKPSVNVQILLLPAWPVFWAIGLDQVL